LWIGTEGGATRYTPNGFEALKKQPAKQSLRSSPEHITIHQHRTRSSQATVKTVTETLAAVTFLVATNQLLSLATSSMFDSF
jgi:hypothetical protein